jgi:tRNA (guanine-N7-)-methyltransferase
MGKDKLRRFAENLTFGCMKQPEFDEIFRRDHHLKGRWREEFFGNDNPIILELGCGRGEYTVALAAREPDKNFIGIDIKGARMWRGAKTTTDRGMKNVAFLRTRIEFISSFFGPDEVDGIWITFPDPQLKKNRVKKRLTSPGFLRHYAGFLKQEGIVRLKTDSAHLHNYTRVVAESNNLPVIECCEDIYGLGFADEVLSVKTAYEEMFLAKGVPITYMSFSLGCAKTFEAPDFNPDDEL